MKLTLRKIKVIEKAIEKAIAAQKTATSVTISAFADAATVPAAVEKARSAYTAALVTLARLEDIQYAIREEVGRANVMSGIATLLAEQAKLKKRQKRVQTIAATTPAQSQDILAQELASLKRRIEENSDFYGDRELTVSIFDDATVATAKADAVTIQRRLTAIQEDLDRLNYATEIEIPDGDHAFLVDAAVV